MVSCVQSTSHDHGVTRIKNIEVRCLHASFCVRVRVRVCCLAPPLSLRVLCTTLGVNVNVRVGP